jgi:hypothetical protein
MLQQILVESGSEVCSRSRGDLEVVGEASATGSLQAQAIGGIDIIGDHIHEFLRKCVKFTRSCVENIAGFRAT